MIFTNAPIGARTSPVRLHALLGVFKFTTPIIGGFRDKHGKTPASDSIIIFDFTKFAKTTNCHITFFLLSSPPNGLSYQRFAVLLVQKEPPPAKRQVHAMLGNAPTNRLAVIAVTFAIPADCDVTFDCRQLVECPSKTILVFFRDTFCSYRDWETDRKSTRLNSSHSAKSRMPSSA